MRFRFTILTYKQHTYYLCNEDGAHAHPKNGGSLFPGDPHLFELIPGEKLLMEFYE